MTEVYSKVHQTSYNASVTYDYFDYTINSLHHTAGDYYSFQREDTLVGTYNPGWKSIIRAGGDATSNLQGIKHTYEGNLDFTYTRRGHYDFPVNNSNSFGYDLFGKAPWFWANDSTEASDSLRADVTNRAIRKFLDSAKSARSSFEAGQDLGEIKQTIESIVHPMNSLKKLTVGYFSTLKKAKSRYRDVSSLRKALSDSYLEYRFGWRPLALDLADAISGLSSRQRMKATAPCHGSAFGQESKSVGSTTPLWCYDARMVENTNSYVNFSYRVSGAIRLNLDSNGRIPLAQSLQLSTLNDFAVTAWDLLPYSFVVDYFTNVGDIINAITFPTSDLTYVCGTERTQIIRELSCSIVNIPNSGGQIWDLQLLSPQPAAKFIITKIKRARLSSIDLIPSVRISLPVSSRPWENIAALISSNVKSLVPFHK